MNRKKRGRPDGSREKDNPERREKILQALTEHLLSHPKKMSLRETAQVAGVSVATMYHYFGSRDAVLREVLEFLGRIGAGHHHPRLADTKLPFADSMNEVAALLVEAFKGPVLAIHQLGLIEGFGLPSLGAAYLQNILEPACQALEARLRLHDTRHEMRAGEDLRTAALEFISPLLVASLHQTALNGRSCRKLNIPALAKTISRHFVEIYGVRKFPGRV